MKMFSKAEITCMTEAVCVAIGEHGYQCEDGHRLKNEELAEWTDEMFVEAFFEIYPAANG